MSIEIKEFDFRNGTDEQYMALNRCRNQIRLERLPDDPPVPLEESIQMLKNLPDFIQIKVWLAQRPAEGDIVGYGLIQYSLEDNVHMAQFTIDILPAFRRQGLGTQLLAKIAGIAQLENRRLLITNTSERIPAGQTFVTRLGASKGLETHTNQLVLADVDLDLVAEWRNRAPERAPDFELITLTGRYPDNYLDVIVGLHDLFNQQPFGDLEIGDFTFTADHVRQSEKGLFTRGYGRWSIFVRHKQDGNFVGYTEVVWHPNRPDVIDQGLTGVFPQYRSNGLGKWLKAEMLAKIIRERPQAKFIRTGNADSNVPMMKINEALGFKPYMAQTVWQVETEKVIDYLDA